MSASVVSVTRPSRPETSSVESRTMRMVPGSAICCCGLTLGRGARRRNAAGPMRAGPPRVMAGGSGESVLWTHLSGEVRHMTSTQRSFRTFALAALLFAAAACNGTKQPGATGGSSSAAGSVRARDMTLNNGIVLRLRSLTALSTRTNHEGDAVRATLTQAALSEHGDTIIPADAEFSGSVMRSAPGKENQAGTLQLSFTQVRWGGKSWPVGTRVTSIAEETSGRGITGGTAAK